MLSSHKRYRSVLIAIPLLVLAPRIASAVELRSVNVNREGQAVVQYEMSARLTKAPSMRISRNLIDLSFPQTSLAPKLGGKLDLKPDHILIQRITAYRGDRGLLRSRIVVNGSAENLKQRIEFRLTKRAEALARQQWLRERDRATSTCRKMTSEFRCPAP